MGLTSRFDKQSKTRLLADVFTQICLHRDVWSNLPCKAGRSQFYLLQDIPSCMHKQIVVSARGKKNEPPTQNTDPNGVMQPALIAFDEKTHAKGTTGRHGRRRQLTCMCWVMLLLAFSFPASPTLMCTGLWTKSRANRCTSLGQVAVKNRVWRFGGIASMIVLICGSKPMSSMRSASSSASTMTFVRLILPICMMSFSRPGVAITT